MEGIDEQCRSCANEVVKTLSEHNWSQRLLDALAAERVEFLPYVPDGVLAPLLTLAAERPEFTLLPLSREEEGVGVAAGVHLAGRRAALLMQASGMGNSLNAIGSLVMAQRIPLLMVVTERGGLGETVSTQVPFGAALRRVLDAVGIHCYEIADPAAIPRIVPGAVQLAELSRVPVVLLITSQIEHAA